jgi:hypothetical protein
MPKYKQKKKTSSLSTAEHELAKLQNEYLKGLRRLQMEQTSEGKFRLIQDLHRQYKYPLKQLPIISGLPKETYYGRVFNSFEELEQVINTWIHYYNKQIKKKLNWKSLIQYRLTYSK